MSLAMDSTSSTLLLSHSHSHSDEKQATSKTARGVLIFEPASLQKKSAFPSEFVWPSNDLVDGHPDELKEPLIDLSCFSTGDEKAIATAAELVRTACLKHGFFQVTHHGIDPALIRAAYDEIDTIFKLPLEKKLAARRKPGSVSGYSGAHADRYSSKLPWKETFSFGYNGNASDTDQVVAYFKSVFGEDLENTGWVYEKYCKAMEEVALVIMELLAVSLGIDRMHLREFFKDSDHSIMRCNYYPPCLSSDLTLGTGPHSDPTSITILHQDNIGGLEVFADNKWHSVRPRPDALVINLGDTFMALSNGKFKSCLHRALVNRERERRSLVFFVNPRKDKVVRPPEKLFGINESRKYPDFTWSDMYEFTQKHYRADVATLQSFIRWFQSSKTLINS